MTRPFDVAIAGAGPAGAACALRLARAGFSVALIDQREFPREKLCGEYVNLGAIRELQDLQLAANLRPRAHPLEGMRLYAHGETAAFKLPSEAWSLSRAVLDADVRDAAIAAGAHPLTGRVRQLRVGASEIEIEWHDPAGDAHTLRARYLAGADGMHSAVARLCNLTVSETERRFALGAHYRGVKLDRWIEMYASAHEYLALNPMGGESANAVFVLQKDRLARSRTALGQELGVFSRHVSSGRRPIDGAAFANSYQATGPLAHRTAHPAMKRVLLVGDAAAFVDPFTGQGVFLALAGARDAAAAFARALGHAHAEHAAWRDYAASVMERVAERRRIAAMMKLMLGVRFATRRAAAAMRKRPGDFTFLIEAVSGNAAAYNSLELATAVGKVLR